MFEPLIIQGGMGVAISTWPLARAVSSRGQLGVVSCVGIGVVLIGRLAQGDEGGYVRRALAHFPAPDVAERLIDRYFVEGGKPTDAPFPRADMWTLDPPRELAQLEAAGAFVEVWLAKQGHDRPVGMNVLEKAQLPNLATLYGAMLAGVEYVIVGAGIPTQFPGALDRFAKHGPASFRIDVHGAGRDERFELGFDPSRVFPSLRATASLTRPYFLPIVSSVVLARALLKRANGRVDGFVVEHHTAGGHNAPPRGGVQLDEAGEPVYGERDEVELSQLRDLGHPFWLAGGYGSPEGLRRALDGGAAGIQVGTLFAYSADSGLADAARSAVLHKLGSGTLRVRTDATASPTGFPFKVVPLEGSLSEPEVRDARRRVCDIGILRQPYRREDGTLGYRCSAEPVAQYAQKGGSPEDTRGRVCLCNCLSATAGFPQVRRGGVVEPFLVTSGDDLPRLRSFLDGRTSYHASDVIDYLLS
jgi:nitronate monooxygenase